MCIKQTAKRLASIRVWTNEYERGQEQQDWKRITNYKMLSNNWIQNWGGYKANERKTILKSSSNIVQRKLPRSKPFRFYLFHLIHSAHRSVCVWVSAFFMMSAGFFLPSGFHFYCQASIHTKRDLLVFYVRAMLNSKLAKFNKISTQSQLRSNSLDFILSQLLLTSSLCLFAVENNFFFVYRCYLCVRSRQRQKSAWFKFSIDENDARVGREKSAFFFFGRRHSIDSSVLACILLFRQKFLHFLFTLMWSNALWFAGCCGCCC